MKAMQVHLPASLDSLALADLADLGDPGHGAIKVRLRASSLNYHDYAVCVGLLPTAEGRIPLSDGAGDVIDSHFPMAELANAFRHQQSGKYFGKIAIVI